MAAHPSKLGRQQAKWLCHGCPPVSPSDVGTWWVLREAELVSMSGPRSLDIASVHIFGPNTRLHAPPQTASALSFSITGLIGGHSLSPLVLRAPSRASYFRWVASLRHAIEASPFSNACGNPHGSFAPARADGGCRWFSSGCAYFSAVADAMESATENILMTAWYLSPEVIGPLSPRARNQPRSPPQTASSSPQVTHSSERKIVPIL